MADPMQAALTKPDLRRAMRERRRAVPEPAQRSLRIWAYVGDLASVLDARRILCFTTLAGEPDTDPFVAWCRALGKDTAVPEDGVDPSWPDVAIVPGLAFTAHGDRLGQGGGWYDRFLALVRDDCTTIGVCFQAQVVDAFETEPHDVRLDCVITELGSVSAS